MGTQISGKVGCHQTQRDGTDLQSVISPRDKHVLTQQEAMFAFDAVAKHVSRPDFKTNSVHHLRQLLFAARAGRSAAWAPQRRDVEWFLRSRWERESSIVQFAQRRIQPATAAMNGCVDSEKYAPEPPAGN